jgi:glycosyltransferase involved in cell wall biosynthesis
MKTILHVIDTTGPGGAETVFVDLATRLPAPEYRHVVVLHGKGWVYEELQRRGVEPVLLDASGSFNISYLRSLIRLVRRENVDLLQGHLLGASIYCSMVGLLTRRPVVATFHGSVDIEPDERLKRLKFAVINAGAGRVVAVSEGLRDDLFSITSLRHDRMEVIYNGIRTQDFQRSASDSLRGEFGWSRDDFVVGSLGNVRPAKAYDVLLRAAALLETSERSVRFVVAGQPDRYGLYEELMALRERLGMESRVQFLGFVDDPADFLGSVDLFLSTSRSEGLPLSAIQAMATGLPLLATRCGGYEELVTDRVNGWLVDVDDPSAVAESILALAASPTRRAELGEEARRHVRATFDISAMLEAYDALYDELIVGSPRNPKRAR